MFRLEFVLGFQNFSKYGLGPTLKTIIFLVQQSNKNGLSRISQTSKQRSCINQDYGKIIWNYSKIQNQKEAQMASYNLAFSTLRAIMSLKRYSCSRLETLSPLLYDLTRLKPNTSITLRISKKQLGTLFLYRNQQAQEDRGNQKRMTKKVIFMFQRFIKDYLFLSSLSTLYLTNMSTPIPIIPRTYIDTSFNDRLCQLCLSPSEEMMICSGACQKYYCAMCVVQNGLEGCQNQLQPNCAMEMVKDWPVRFHCPYDRQQCTVKTHSVEEFWKHCETCQFMPKQAKEELQNKREYRCTKGHRLIFITEGNFDQIYEQGDHYFTTCQEICMYCKEKVLSKSICFDCGIGHDKVIYCIFCRPIPCEKDRCPLGHNFEKTFRLQRTLRCDFCGIWAVKNGKYAFGDRQCNFDICAKCHQRADQRHKLVPLENMIEQKYDKKLWRLRIERMKEQIIEKLARREKH